MSALSTRCGIATQHKVSDLTNVDNSAPMLPLHTQYIIHQFGYQSIEDSDVLFINLSCEISEEDQITR